ncbi:hypothetical protein D3C76_1498330 [compost metagenome]
MRVRKASCSVFRPSTSAESGLGGSSSTLNQYKDSRSCGRALDSSRRRTLWPLSGLMRNTGGASRKGLLALAAVLFSSPSSIQAWASTGILLVFFICTVTSCCSAG